MNVLLDTCTIIWIVSLPQKLSSKARDILDKLGVSPSGVHCLYWMELYPWRIEAY